MPSDTSARIRFATAMSTASGPENARTSAPSSTATAWRHRHPVAKRSSGSGASRPLTTTRSPASSAPRRAASSPPALTTTIRSARRRPEQRVARESVVRRDPTPTSLSVRPPRRASPRRASHDVRRRRGREPSTPRPSTHRATAATTARDPPVDEPSAEQSRDADGQQRGRSIGPDLPSEQDARRSSADTATSGPASARGITR